MKNVTTVAICLTPETLKRIDEKAEFFGLSRSTLIAKILEKNIREEGTKCLSL